MRCWVYIYLIISDDAFHKPLFVGIRKDNLLMYLHITVLKL